MGILFYKIILIRAEETWYSYNLDTDQRVNG